MRKPPFDSISAWAIAMFLMSIIAGCNGEPVSDEATYDDVSREESSVPEAASDEPPTVLDEGTTPGIGQIAHDFALTDTDGATVDLSEVAAEATTLLVFYRGHW